MAASNKGDTSIGRGCSCPQLPEDSAFCPAQATCGDWGLCSSCHLGQAGSLRGWAGAALAAGLPGVWRCCTRVLLPEHSLGALGLGSMWGWAQQGPLGGWQDSDALAAVIHPAKRVRFCCSLQLRFYHPVTAAGTVPQLTGIHTALSSVGPSVSFQQGGDCWLRSTSDLSTWVRAATGTWGMPALAPQRQQGCRMLSAQPQLLPRTPSCTVLIL